MENHYWKRPYEHLCLFLEWFCKDIQALMVENKKVYHRLGQNKLVIGGLVLFLCIMEQTLKNCNR